MELGRKEKVWQQLVLGRGSLNLSTNSTRTQNPRFPKGGRCRLPPLPTYIKPHASPTYGPAIAHNTRTGKQEEKPRILALPLYASRCMIARRPLRVAALFALPATAAASFPFLAASFSSSSGSPGMATEKGSTTVAKAIKDIELEKIKGPTESSHVKVGSFFEDQAAVVHILRRFGCKLCRGNALELKKIVPILEANNVRVVAVGIEKLGVEEFLEGGYWDRELYIDNGKKIHQALSIKSVGVLGTAKMLFDIKDALKKLSHVPGNLKGDGRQLGATFVFAKGGAMMMDFRQKDFADHPSNQSILEACGLDPSLCPSETETGAKCDG